MNSLADIKDILSPGWRDDIFERWDIVPDEEFTAPIVHGSQEAARA